MSKPFVSVLIDTYNHERFIEEAITSVLEQNFCPSDFEILVVDDGSTDRTPELVRKFGPRVRHLCKENGGQASAFNLGIPQCSGEIVAFLDGDDWWARDKLSRVISAFASDPAVGFVGHGITEVLQDGSKRSELVRETHHVHLDTVSGARTFRLRKSFLGTSRMAIRADVLRRIGQIPTELVIQADECLFTLAILFSGALILREPLTFYRLHSGNLFQVGSGNATALRRKREVLNTLASILNARLQKENVPADVSKIIVESVQAEADLIRLSLDSCWPWDTVRIEINSFRIMCENAPVRYWLAKSLSLIPALFLPSRNYIAVKNYVVANRLYRKTRERVLPTLRPNHVDRQGFWGRS